MGEIDQMLSREAKREAAAKPLRFIQFTHDEHGPLARIAFEGEMVTERPTKSQLRYWRNQIIEVLDLEDDRPG